MIKVTDLDNNTEYFESNSEYFEIISEHSPYTTELFIHKICMVINNHKVCIYSEIADAEESVDKLTVLKTVKASYEISKILDTMVSDPDKDIYVNQLAKDCIDIINFKLIDTIISSDFNI